MASRAPLSVPKILADRSYTPEVAARRLRDIMEKLSDDALNYAGTRAGPFLVGTDYLNRVYLGEAGEWGCITRIAMVPRRAGPFVLCR